jgi:peptide/nickel transport system substrate-binding protein
MRSDFGGFNPITSSAGYDIELINYALFTPLVQYDENLEVQPYLAESWEIQDDTAVVFQLRRDVRWHDGQPVTAHDVEFTFNAAKNPESASLLGTAFLTDVESARVIDDHTIVFRFSRPHAQALEDFWWAPAPRHLLEGIAPASCATRRSTVSPWAAGRSVSAPGAPMSSSPSYAILISRRGSADPLLRTASCVPRHPGSVHDADVHADGRRAREHPAAAGPGAAGAGARGHRPVLVPGRTVFYVGWNNVRPPFDNVLVRRAMAHAINHEEIVDALLYGEGMVATSTIPPWHRLYPGGVEPLPYDPQQADLLLEQAGWSATGDGIRENAQGQRSRSRC